MQRWWKKRGWEALGKLLPDWLREALEVFRPVLLVLDAQIAALTAGLEKAAAPDLPGGLTHHLTYHRFGTWGALAA